MSLRSVGAFTLLGIAAVLAVPARASSSAPGIQSQEREQAEKQKEKERIEKVREKEKAKGAEQAKEREAAKTPKPASAPASAAEQREVAKKAAHFAHNHRMVQARIARLIEIYKAKGDREKVAKLEDLRARQLKRNDNAMARFRKQLSSENWARLNTELEKPSPRTERSKAKTPPKSGGR